MDIERKARDVVLFGELEGGTVFELVNKTAGPLMALESFKDTKAAACLRTGMVHNILPSAEVLLLDAKLVVRPK